MSNGEILWDWNYWCRTCGKNDFNNLESFYKWNSLDDGILEILKKQFSINLTILEYGEAIICINCHTFLNELVTFTKHCGKINTMFNEIKLNYENANDHDLLSAVRNRYGLDSLNVNEEISTCAKVDDMNNLLKIEIKIEQPNDTAKESIEDETLVDSSRLMEQQNIFTAVVSVGSHRRGDKNKKNKSHKAAGTLNKRNSLKRVNANYDAEYFEDDHGENDNDYVLGMANAVDNVDYLMKKEDCLNTNEEKVSRIENKIKRIPKKKNKNYKCRLCSVVDFTKESQRLAHLKKHHSKDEFPFDCTKCPKRFTTSRGLKVHELVHLLPSEKPPKDPIVCEQCGKWCMSNAALSEHQAMHREDYPYECVQCMKKFKHLYHLRTHMKTHSGIVFACDTCEQRFKSKATLTHHMVVHSEHKKFRCNYCGNEYKRSKTLKTHLILHTGERPYKCQFCDKTFTSGSNCRFHKKKVHPQELSALKESGELQPITTLPKLQQLQPK